MADATSNDSEIERLEPGEDDARRVEAGFVPPSPQPIDTKGLVERVREALVQTQTTPPVE